MSPQRRQDPLVPLVLKMWWDQGRLIVNDEYQRNPVWSRPQEQLLIDTILNDWDVPKIYLFERPDGVKEVVDGQQRLLAIFRFMNGEFALPQDQSPVRGHAIAGSRFADLPDELQAALGVYALTVVTLQEYAQDDVEDFFVRLQEGVSLKPAEKRRALAGQMPDVVAQLGLHPVFPLCARFHNRNYGYEDAVAKVLHMLLAGEITGFSAAAIRRTYTENINITPQNSSVTRLRQAYDYLHTGFQEGFQATGVPPRLPKFAMITLPYLICELRDNYAMGGLQRSVTDSYLQFEEEREANQDLAEEDQDRAFASYSDAARADDVARVQMRHDVLREWLLTRLPLVPLDTQRQFTEAQRRAIYRRDDGRCQMCIVGNPDVERLPYDEWDADHIQRHADGGPTTVENGRVLCIPHNRGEHRDG